MELAMSSSIGDVMTVTHIEAEQSIWEQLGHHRRW